MWMFTRYGFFSVVAAKRRGSKKTPAPLDPTQVMVRARNPDHLHALVAAFPRLWPYKVVHTPHNDYTSRVVIPTAVWVEVAAELCAAPTGYGNFKQEVKDAHLTDPEYGRVLGDVWTRLYTYQEKQAR